MTELLPECSCGKNYFSRGPGSTRGCRLHCNTTGWAAKQPGGRFYVAPVVFVNDAATVFQHAREYQLWKYYTHEVLGRNNSLTWQQTEPVFPGASASWDQFTKALAITPEAFTLWVKWRSGGSHPCEILSGNVFDAATRICPNCFAGGNDLLLQVTIPQGQTGAFLQFDSREPSGLWKFAGGW